jgi:nucleolar MIF4G domain-containing protein 1
MVSAIMDLKNNKRRQQDTMYMEKTAKLRKFLGRIKSTAATSSSGKTTSESSLRISFQDVLNAETKGRWWKVGASWVGNQYRFTDNADRVGNEGGGDNSENKGTKGNSGIVGQKDAEQDEALLRLASKYRMNTDQKRAIFCIIMGCADCEDAFEKLCRGGMLQNRSERDTVRVLMECCGNEKSYNKFYSHLASKICDFQPQCRFSFQLAFWDAFKQFDTMSLRKAANLAKLLFHLVAVHQVLKLTSVIKVIDMSSTEEMEENALIFLTICLTSILEYADDPLLIQNLLASHHPSSKKSVGDEIGLQDDQEGAQASLLVFLLETLKSSPKNKKGSKFRKNYKAAVKALDTDRIENMF